MSLSHVLINRDRIAVWIGQSDVGRALSRRISDLRELRSGRLQLLLDCADALKLSTVSPWLFSNRD